MRLRHALTTTVTVGVLMLCAACSGDAPAADPRSSNSPAGSGTGASADPAVDEHAVPAPGPRQPGVLAPADILVVGGKSLDPEKVKAVTALKHVTAMQFALSEPVIENEALTVAAVDPGAYRNFTPLKYANLQEAWDRVAGGELALKQ